MRACCAAVRAEYRACIDAQVRAGGRKGAARSMVPDSRAPALPRSVEKSIIRGVAHLAGVKIFA